MRAALFLALLAFLCLDAAYAQPGTCVHQPNSAPSTIEGAPFFDCGGFEAWALTPTPTAMPHAFDINVGIDLCIRSDFILASWMSPIYPNITHFDSNRTIYNTAVFPGDVIMMGEMVKWVNLPGGRVEGEIICASQALDIEVDGVCICGEPVPEPSLALGLMIGVLGLVALPRGMGRSHVERRTCHPGSFV